MSYRPFATAALFLALSVPMPAAAAAKTTKAAATTRRTVQAFPLDVKARGDRLWNAASPAVKAWATQHAPAVARGTGDPATLVASAIQTRWSNLPPEHARVRSGAPDTLAFILNYEAAKISQADIKAKLDSLSGLGETESLRLQMMMDRLSKFMSTLSNVLKKISDTADGIVGNLK